MERDATLNRSGASLQSSLPRVAQVCKRLHQLTTPLLYRTVVFPISKYIVDTARSPQKQCLPAVMRLVCAHTRDLTIQGSAEAGSQGVLREILRNITSAQKLTRLWFDKNCRMNYMNYKWLELALNSPANENLRATLSTLNLPRYYQGYCHPLPMLDCNVQATFSTTNLAHNRVIRLSATGQIATDNSPAEGVPILLLENFFRIWGTRSGLQSLRIDAQNNLCRLSKSPLFVLSQDGVQMVDIMSLKLTGVDFHPSRFPEDFYTAINPSSLQSLEIRECLGANYALDELRKLGIKLERFKYSMWIKQIPSATIDVHSRALTHFLDSFSGLMCCRILDSVDLRLDFDTVFRKHTNTLQDLALNLGAAHMLDGMFVKLLRLCPRLKTLGFRHEAFSLPFVHGNFEGKANYSRGGISGFDKAFGKIAKRLVGFTALTTIACYSSPVPNPKPIKYERDWWPEETTSFYWEEGEEADDYRALFKRIFCHLDLATVHARNIHPSTVKQVLLSNRPLPIEYVAADGRPMPDKNLYRRVHRISEPK